VRYLNLPNFLSFLRMVAVIPIWWALDHNSNFLAFCFYVGALLTDYFDGVTARKFQQVTDIGKLLDPLADKVLHLFLLYHFQVQYPQLATQFILILWLAVALAALPGMVFLFRVERRLGSNWFGKVKLCAEGAAILLLFCRKPDMASILLWLAVILAATSIIGHLLIKEGMDYRWWRKRET
jgi:cardiolipin synthase (CMP-forming)